MQEQAFWCGWANNLQRWGLKDTVAAVLEALGPLSIFLAQAVYLGQPFFGKTLPTDQSNALANMLENPSISRSFAAFLRQEE